jgi:hypothetical protein
VLKDLLACKIKGPDVLWLASRIIDHSNPQEEVQQWYPGDDLFTPGQRRRGLPLGNQTSQFFAEDHLETVRQKYGLDEDNSTEDDDVPATSDQAGGAGLDTSATT